MSELGEILVTCDDCNEKVPVSNTWIVNGDVNHVVCSECAEHYVTELGEILVTCDDCYETVPVSDTCIVNSDVNHVVCSACAEHYEEKSK